MELVRLVREEKMVARGIQIIQILIVLGGSLLLFACGETATREVSAAPPPAAASAPVPPTPSSDNSFVASGPLVVEHQVDVAAQRDGLVTTIAADEGQRVRQGQLLASLDDRQISADLEAARAKTRSIEADLNNWEAETKVLEADLQRSQQLWESHVISKEQLDHDQFKVEADRWDVKRVQQLLVNSREVEKSLELELEKTRIRAPFDGLVARRYARTGQEVAKGDRLFWVTAEGPLRIRLTLPEKFLGRIRKGATLELTTPDLPGEKHAVKIIQVSSVVDPSSATIEVLAELTGPHGQLRPGMAANVTIPNPQ